MLFEIHDIILHRLWKAARRNYYAVANGPVGPKVTVPEFHNWQKLMNIRYKWMQLTNRWYMNHVRRGYANAWYT